MDLIESVRPWPGVIRPYAIPGLLTCLEEGRLCSDGSPLPASRFDVEALSLAEWAFTSRRALVLCPPDPLAPLSELIAAAVHVADMAKVYRAGGRPAGSRCRIAVVSADYRTRGLYRGLSVRKPGSLSAVPLRDVVPAATLGRDGVVRVLGGDTGRGWSTVFVGSVAELRSVGDVDLVVLELPASGAEEILDLGIPGVLIARDPADPLLTRLADNVLVFGWDETDLERVRDDAGIPPRLACRARGGGCEVVAVPSHAVCENAALFWQDVGALVRLGGRSVVARELSREAFSLFHDLLGLALPLDVYEELTTPVRVRIDAIATAARLTQGETRDLYLPMVEAELRDLAEAMGTSPPKREALVLTLGQLLDNHNDVMLVARTAELARLYTSQLATDRSLARVRVSSLSALSEQAPAEVAVLTGMAPTWARWVYRAGIAASLRVLAYAPEGRIESVPQGFSEVDKVRRIVADQRMREAWLARPVQKDRVWSNLSGDQRLVADDSRSAAFPRDLDDVSVVTTSPIEVPPGLWDGGHWLAPIEPGGTSDGVRRHAGSDGRPIKAVVDAVRVTFDHGRWALMDIQGTVTRFRAGSGTTDPAYPVSRLREGDQVLFFDGDSRKDLLGKVLEVAGEVPELAVAAAWLGHWRRVLSAAHRRFGSYVAFTSALHEHGCVVQDQTVRLWVVGVTIGPDDEEDVRRVGLVTDDAGLLAGHAEICQAMRSLRGAHVRLSKRLPEIARHVGSATAAGRVARDEVIDERSGLTAADFQDSIDIVTVRTVERVGETPYVVVGRLNDVHEEESDV
jgi:hypothetical protein